MNRLAFLATAGAVSAVFAGPVRSASSAPKKEHHHLNSLADIQKPEALRARTHAMDVFAISQMIATRTPIAPEKLETYPDVVKHHVSDEHKIAEIYAALHEAKPVASKQGFEYRWKVVALDAGGERIAEIYASAITHHGMTGDGTRFEFSNGRFTDYLQEHFTVVPVINSSG